MPRRSAWVVDTNVAVAANGSSPGTSLECEDACREKLLAITRGRARLILDDWHEIFDQYRRHLSLSGQPGVGDLFLKWVHDHQYDARSCERVMLTQHPTRVYVEFPDDPELAAFHRDDRVFACAAMASRSRARVLNALDSDWWEFERALARHGVRVVHVCGDRVKAWSRERRRR